MKNNKLIFAILIAALPACSGNSSKLNTNQSFAKLEIGSDCQPLNFNNNSEVLVLCSDGTAIWSEDAGLSYLPPHPKVLSITPPGIELFFSATGFSDDGKVLFEPTAPFDQPEITELPPESYLYDGANYIKLDSSYSSISDNGEYLAGVDLYFQPMVLKNLQAVAIAKLPGISSILRVSGVNNNGTIAATIAYSDVNHAYSNYFAAKINLDSTIILPPGVRPDKNSSSATEINSSGDVLIATFEQVANQEERERALVVEDSGSVVDLYPENTTVSSSGGTSAFNDNSVAIIHVQGQTLVYQKGKGVSSIQDAIEAESDVDLSNSNFFLNDLNQVLVSTFNAEGQAELRIYNLK